MGGYDIKELMILNNTILKQTILQNYCGFIKCDNDLIMIL